MVSFFIGLLYFTDHYKRIVLEFNLQREMRKTKSEQEGDHKTISLVFSESFYG